MPAWVGATLMARMAAERAAEYVPTCNGTLLSREQYLFDLRERGYADARVPSWGSVLESQIGIWTEAIVKRR